MMNDKRSPRLKLICEDEYSRVRICKDADTDINEPKDWHVVLHFDIPSEEQYTHIRFEREEANQLHKWLTKFLIATKE